jgi:hypothetical protein
MGLLDVLDGAKQVSGFSTVLPPTVQWDGRTATIKTKLEGLGLAQSKGSGD